MRLVGEFVRAVGSRVAHVTAAENSSGIERDGLRSAATLAQVAGEKRDISLRRDRTLIQGRGVRARLNHQKPILDGLLSAKRILEGYDPAAWAAQLDQRIFFWPEREGESFSASVARDFPTETIWLDAAKLAELFFASLDMAPINTGNFRQGGAHALRGNWIYVPLIEGIDAFRSNRQRRGLVKQRDVVKEISLRVGVSAENLRLLRVQ